MINNSKDVERVTKDGYALQYVNKEIIDFVRSSLTQVV